MTTTDVLKEAGLVKAELQNLPPEDWANPAFVSQSIGRIEQAERKLLRARDELAYTVSEEKNRGIK